MQASIALLFGPALVSALVLPRDEWDTKFDEWKEGKPNALVNAFSRAKGKFVKGEGADDANEYGIFDDYEKPNQYLKVVLSPGDSYTAGIGSNGPGDHYLDSGDVGNNGCSRFRRGWPEALRDLPRWKEQQGDGWRKNNFGACSGAVIQDIKGKQLEEGENKDENMFKKVGSYPNAPQIAVFTAGGNDMKFADIVKACIYTIPTTGDCDKILEWADHRLNDEAERQKLKEDYHALYADIIVAGRIALAAGGPNKPANFQLFHGTYIPFFDDEDDVCDEISWYLIGAAYRRLLTRDFRKKLNKLAVDLNKVIREAADEYKKYGVFWVDSYVDKFKEHRFCSPTGFGRDFDLVYHSNKFQDDGDRTWFWSIQSRYRNGDEGPHLDQTDWTGRSTPNVTQAILDHLNIDKAGQDKLAQGAPWDQISPALKDEEAFETAISDLEVKDNDGEVIINLNDGFNRVFHPKGTALDVIANGFFDTIVAQRDWTFDKNDAPTSTTPQPTPSSEPTQPEQPVTAGKTLTVGLEQDKQCWDSEQGAQQCTTPENRWFFFTTNTGEEPGTICGELADGFVLKESWKDADFFNNLSWPGGEFNLKLNGMDYVYKCDGSNPGKLFHGEQAFDCWGDLTQEDPKQQECSQDSAFPEKRRRVVSCDF